jgi:hypothetical protein
MPGREYVDRVRSDYRKTFKPASGKHVLMDLYDKCHGMSTTLPQTGNPFEMARNEGKRVVLLYIVDKLKEDDQDLRKLWEHHIAERVREETA